MDTSEKKFSKKDMFISKDAQFSAPPCVKFLTVFVGNFLSYGQKTGFSPSLKFRATSRVPGWIPGRSFDFTRLKCGWRCWGEKCGHFGIKFFDFGQFGAEPVSKDV